MRKIKDIKNSFESYIQRGDRSLYMLSVLVSVLLPVLYVLWMLIVVWIANLLNINNACTGVLLLGPFYFFVCFLSFYLYKGIFPHLKKDAFRLLIHAFKYLFVYFFICLFLYLFISFYNNNNDLLKTYIRLTWFAPLYFIVPYLLFIYTVIYAVKDKPVYKYIFFLTITVILFSVIITFNNMTVKQWYTGVFEFTLVYLEIVFLYSSFIYFKNFYKYLFYALSLIIAFVINQLYLAGNGVYLAYKHDGLEKIIITNNILNNIFLFFILMGIVLAILDFFVYLLKRKK